MGDTCHVCKIRPCVGRSYQCGACFKPMCSADAYERAGSFICRRCKMAAESPPDPSDARIAELEAALAGLVDALPRCDTCTKRGTTDWSGYGQAAIYCDEHLGFKSGSTLEWDSEAEAAERALGRRK